MEKRDWLFVGLKLLGVYAAIMGLAYLAGFFSQLLGMSRGLQKTGRYVGAVTSPGGFSSGI